jgi:Xylose isomerase-like TIM barrel
VQPIDAAQRWNALLALHGVEAPTPVLVPWPYPRLSLNQATVKYASLADALAVTGEAGIRAIGLWREPVAEVGLEKAGTLVADSDLRVSSLCRAGFFTAPRGPPVGGSRWGPPCDRGDRGTGRGWRTRPGTGARPGRRGLPAGDRDLPGARQRARDAIGELVEDARAAGVVLAIEPMHPMFAADRGVVSTLGQALDIAEQFPAESVGVVVDTYHVWWDPALPEMVARAGLGGRIAN